MLPITATMPKPLVKVAGQSLIDFALDKLREAGVESVVVNVHHFADMLEAHLRTRETPRIVISDERGELLETGGGVKKALPLLGERSLHHLQLRLALDRGTGAEPEAPREGLGPGADGHPDARGAVIHKHRLTRAAAIFIMDEDGRLRRRGTDDSAPFVYAGVAIVKPELVHGTPEGAFSANALLRPRHRQGPPLRLVHGRAMAACWRAPGHCRGRKVPRRRQAMRV